MSIPAKGTNPNPGAGDPSPEPSNTSVTVDDPATGTPVVVVEEQPKPKVISVPTSAMRKIKDEAAAVGRTARDQELDAEAQELGYANYKAWKEASALARQQAQQASQKPLQSEPEPKPAAEPQSSVKPEDRTAALEQENQRLRQTNEGLLEEKRRLNRDKAKAQRELAKLKDEITNAQTETELKLAAQEAGVIDTEYAVAVYMRAIQDMNEEELKGMDEKKFFSENMRASHPHLYKPTDRPVNTGTRSDPKVTTPATGSTQPKPNGGETKNALTMTPDEFKNRLRQLGIGSPSSGGALS